MIIIRHCEHHHRPSFEKICSYLEQPIEDSVQRLDETEFVIYKKSTTGNRLSEELMDNAAYGEPGVEFESRYYHVGTEEAICTVNDTQMEQSLMAAGRTNLNTAKKERKPVDSSRHAKRLEVVDINVYDEPYLGSGYYYVGMDNEMSPAGDYAGQIDGLVGHPTTRKKGITYVNTETEVNSVCESNLNGDPYYSRPFVQ